MIWFNPGDFLHYQNKDIVEVINYVDGDKTIKKTMTNNYKKIAPAINWEVKDILKDFIVCDARNGDQIVVENCHYPINYFSQEKHEIKK